MPAELPRGVRLGVDVGTVRIGVAASDPDGLVATPVRTVARVADQPGERRTGDLVELAEITADRSAQVVYVGLPRHLSGTEGAASGAVRAYCGALAHAIAPVPVRLVDERLSTVTAHQALHAAGRSGRRHRAVVDQAAAVVILQSAIDAERATGARVGELVPPDEGADPDRAIRGDDGRRGRD
jgi:putative Holliday junction resolvase